MCAGRMVVKGGKVFFHVIVRDDLSAIMVNGGGIFV